LSFKVTCKRRDTVLPLRMVLAWRNLAHDRARFLVMLIGIVFAVTLMAVQMGLLIGFIQTIAMPVEKADADIWVAGRGTRAIDLPGRMPERRRFQALSVPGVAAADPYIHLYANLKRPDGGTELVLVVGFDIATLRGAPWNVSEGRVDDLGMPDSIIVDRLYAAKLGIEARGQVLEINNKRVRVVGFTDGIRTFTQSPHIFTDIKTARRLVGYSEDELNYLLVKVSPHADPAEVRDRLVERIPQTDVHLSADLAHRNRGPTARVRNSARDGCS